MKAWTIDSVSAEPNPGVEARDLGMVFADVLNDESWGNLVEFLGDIFLMFRDDGVPLAFLAGWNRVPEPLSNRPRVFQLQFFLVRPGIRGVSSGRILAVAEDTLRRFGYNQIILPIRTDRERFIHAMTARYGYTGYTDPDDEHNRWFYKNL